MNSIIRITPHANILTITLSCLNVGVAGTCVFSFGKVAFLTERPCTFQLTLVLKTSDIRSGSIGGFRAEAEALFLFGDEFECNVEMTTCVLKICILTRLIMICISICE
jgi:hypothetical protein